MSKDTKEVAIKEGSALDKLRQAYPQHAEDSYVKTFLPQIRFKAKAVLDDDGEKVVTKAGTFVLVNRSEEEVDGKHEYTETVLGDALQADVLFERYRLSYYDSANTAYVSSPIFDSKEEIVKLFRDGKNIASGTVNELQALPEFTVEEDGKTKCKLDLQKVLYVYHDGELREMALSKGNGYAWRSYKQKTVAAVVHTEITSEKTEHGGNKYNQMVFKEAGYLSEEEAERNLTLVEDIKKGIEAEKAFYGQAPVNTGDMTAVPASLPSGEDF